MSKENELFLDLKAKFFKGFSDKTRLAILDSLRDGEKTVSEIVGFVQGNQSNISQHLSCLKGCGIITSRQEGKFIFYSLRNSEILSFLNAAESLLKTVTNEMYCCTHNDELIK